jgi:hypothetical protein
MTIRDRIATAHSTDHDAWPTFELDYLYDDADDPTEVTVFVDATDALATSWLTVGVETAVPLEEVR